MFEYKFFGLQNSHHLIWCGEGIPSEKDEITALIKNNVDPEKVYRHGVVCGGRCVVYKKRSRSIMSAKLAWK